MEPAEAEQLYVIYCLFSKQANWSHCCAKWWKRESFSWGSGDNRRWQRWSTSKWKIIILEKRQTFRKVVCVSLSSNSGHVLHEFLQKTVKKRIWFFLPPSNSSTYQDHQFTANKSQFFKDSSREQILSTCEEAASSCLCATWSSTRRCYDRNPNKRHAAVSVTGQESPFVLLRGDRVVNTASVVFLGRGKLQMLPSQQEVHTWKKGGVNSVIWKIPLPLNKDGEEIMWHLQISKVAIMICLFLSFKPIYFENGSRSSSTCAGTMQDVLCTSQRRAYFSFLPTKK